MQVITYAIYQHTGATPNWHLDRTGKPESIGKNTKNGRDRRPKPEKEKNRTGQERGKEWNGNYI